MQKDFELEVILTITTGISCVDDFNKVLELVRFVYNDEFISTTGLMILKEDLRNHLLTIHPELKGIEGIKISDRPKFQKWLDEQKIKFGNDLAVSLIGKPLKEREHKIKMDEKFEETYLQGQSDIHSSLTMMAVPKNRPYVVFEQESSLKKIDSNQRQKIEESARKFREVNIRNGFEELDVKNESKGSFVKKLK